MNNIESVNESLFESIKHINEYGQEYWTARELLRALEYNEYRFFKKVIEKAMTACEASGGNGSDHFVQVHDMVPIGSGAEREVEDYRLSRYACYLIAMNGDPRKKAIALAQTYFAVKTRQQELIENYDALTDDQKRLAIRQEMKKHNRKEGSFCVKMESPKSAEVISGQADRLGLARHPLARRRLLRSLPPVAVEPFRRVLCLGDDDPVGSVDIRLHRVV